MHPMHGVRKELSQRRIMTTSSLSITGDIEGISLHIANDLLLFIFIRVVHSGLHTLYTKIPLVIGQDIGYTLHIPI